MTVFKTPFIDKNSLAFSGRTKSSGKSFNHLLEFDRNVALEDSVREGTISESMLDEMPKEDRNNKGVLMREISLFKPFLYKIIDNIIV